MRIRLNGWATVAALALLVFAIGQLRAAPDVDTVRPGVYFFKNQYGVWLNTYYKDGTGFSDVRVVHEGEVDLDIYDFTWSMKGREIIRVRTTEPELQLEEHELLLPDGKIQPYKAYREGKLITELPKDIGTMEFLGKPGQPKR